jgi:hypothetical protein
MNNSEWVKWLFSNWPWDPLKIAVFTLLGFGFILVGVAQKKITNVLYGIASFLFLSYLILVPPYTDLHGFIQFELLAVKIFYAVVVSIIVIIILVAFHVRKQHLK